MSVFLLITTLDVAGRRNNREHHAIRLLGRHHDRVIVVFRERAPVDRPLSALLQGSVTLRAEGPVTYLAVSPPVNLPEGAVRGQTTSAPGAGSLRNVVGRMLDTAAIARDAVTIGALTKAAERALAVCDAAPEEITCEAMGPWAAEAARRLRTSGRIARYAYVDRDYEPGFVSSAPRQAWANWMERRAAREADLVLSAGVRLATRLAPFAGDRLHLSPTGVDTDRIAPRLRLQPEPHLAYLGEVAPWACMEDVLEAMVRLVPQWPGIRLSVRGPALPGYADHLRDRAAALGLTDRLDWPGDLPREEALALLDRAGIGLAVFRPTPLRINAAPLKLMEYMAAGLPALAPEGSEAGDILHATGAGAVTAATPDAIATTLAAVLSNPPRHTAMSAAGPPAAAERDWAPVMARELQLLRALDTRRAPHARPRAAEALT